MPPDAEALAKISLEAVVVEVVEVVEVAVQERWRPDHQARLFGPEGLSCLAASRLSLFCGFFLRGSLFLRGALSLSRPFLRFWAPRASFHDGFVSMVRSHSVPDQLDPTELMTATDDSLDLIVQESDKRIAAQVQVMLATDSRSNALLAAGTALAAASFGVAASQYQSQQFSPLVVGAVVTATTAAVAAALAVWALWPRGVETSGWSPILFLPDLRASKSKKQILAEIAAHNQAKIDGNTKCNMSIANRARATMIVLIIAVPLGAIAASVRAFGPLLCR